MALITNFKNIMAEYTSLGSAQTIFTNPASKTTMLLGLDMCNIIDTGITVDVILYDDSSGNDFYLVKNAPIPVGGTLQIINKQKHILEENDSLKIKVATYNNSVHVIAALMEIFTQ